MNWLAENNIEEYNKRLSEQKEHAHGHHGSVSWLIVVLACATGLTIPITVSIVLILRARGVCCVPRVVHHRIDRPGPSSGPQ